jgi:hypothetical protein
MSEVLQMMSTPPNGGTSSGSERTMTMAAAADAAADADASVEESSPHSSAPARSNTDSSVSEIILAQFQLNCSPSLEEADKHEEAKDAASEQQEEEADDEGEEAQSESTTMMTSIRLLAWYFFFSLWIPMILELCSAARSMLVRSLLPTTTTTTITNSESSTASSNKQKYSANLPEPKNAWPPPGLVKLAILTVLTLIVHPDGYTWVLLRKLRFVRYYYCTRVVRLRV